MRYFIQKIYKNCGSAESFSPDHIASGGNPPDSRRMTAIDIVVDRC